MDLKVFPLHERPEFTLQCCELINNEWQRSQTARLRSLEVSRDGLPTCLVLVDGKHTVGHCKLTPIPSIIDACYIESVVIDKKLRGQGLGKHLMAKAEEYCKDFLALRRIYLSTKGQEGFYQKLGYVQCAPISIYGGFVPVDNVGKATGGVDGGNVPVAPPMPPQKVQSGENGGKKTYMCKDI